MRIGTLSAIAAILISSAAFAEPPPSHAAPAARTAQDPLPPPPPSVELKAPAPAAGYTVTFSPQEANAAMALWEIGLKATGDQAADAYVLLRNKLRAAMQAKQ